MRPAVGSFGEPPGPSILGEIGRSPEVASSLVIKLCPEPSPLKVSVSECRKENVRSQTDLEVNSSHL